MSKQRYVHMKFLESEIVAMRAEGKTKKEIALHFRLSIGERESTDQPSKAWLWDAPRTSVETSRHWWTLGM